MFTLEAILIWLLIGAIAGWLAGQVMRGFGFGLLGNIVVGILGAFFGSIVFSALGVSFGGIIGNIIGSTLGAILLLFVIRLIKRA